MDADSREKLKDLRNGLLRLHKNLLDSERAAYERDVQRIRTSGQYLDLVLNDPWFAYLRELSQFIVQVDEALAAKDDSDRLQPDPRALVEQARLLISPSEAGSPFHRKYYEAMQRDAGVILAHRDMMQVFDSLKV